nr:M20/M25/M40 family metallo-hydrolase [Bacilli bacterium]
MAFLMGIDQERLIADFMTLVSIGSPSRDEAHVAAYIRGVVEELGYVVEEDAAADIVSGNSGNLIIRVPGDPTKATILLVAHMDTASPGYGIQPIRLDDRITSDGKTILGADDKAAIAGLLHMLRILHTSKEQHPPLEIVFTVCEEAGLLGAKALDRAVLSASYGYVFGAAGPLGFIANEGPAQAKMQAVVHGKASHAGNAPEKGVSAITIAASAIASMPLGRIDEHTTANVGRIAGGFATNIVCDRVEINAEVRSLYDDRLTMQSEIMTQALEIAARSQGGRVEVKWEASYPALFLPDDAYVRNTLMAAMEATGIRLTYGATGGGSDANIILSKGIPIASLAIGFQQNHTLEEWIALDDLTKSAELMLQIVRQGQKIHQQDTMISQSQLA